MVAIQLLVVILGLQKTMTEIYIVLNGFVGDDGIFTRPPYQLANFPQRAQDERQTGKVEYDPRHLMYATQK